MDSVIIKDLGSPELEEAYLLEGLPGIGEVGRIAASFLIEQLDATEIVRIYSRYFPPQVMVSEDGVIHAMQHELYHARTPGGKDLLILTGDYQGLTAEGQYDLSYEVLRLANDLNVKKVITLGGYGVRKILDEPKVLGAATSEELVGEMKEYGVHFDTEHPAGGIVGASGLLLALADIFEMEGLCLMGETHGSFPDPQAAKIVLRVLDRIFEIGLDVDELDKTAPDIEMLKERLRELEEGAQAESEKTADLNYFA